MTLDMLHESIMIGKVAIQIHYLTNSALVVLLLKIIIIKEAIFENGVYEIKLKTDI